MGNQRCSLLFFFNSSSEPSSLSSVSEESSFYGFKIAFRSNCFFLGFYLIIVICIKIMEINLTLGFCADRNEFFEELCKETRLKFYTSFISTKTHNSIYIKLEEPRDFHRIIRVSDKETEREFNLSV